MNHLNLIKRHIDHILLGQILVIVAFGIIMLYSASSAQSIHITGGKTNSMYLTAHLKRLLIALCAMTAFIFIDYRKLKQWAPILIGVSFGLLSLGLILKIIPVVHFPQGGFI